MTADLFKSLFRLKFLVEFWLGHPKYMISKTSTVQTRGSQPVVDGDVSFFEKDQFKNIRKYTKTCFDYLVVRRWAKGWAPLV